MKNIRALILAGLTGVYAFGMAQPVSAQNMFVEQAVVPQKETAASSELKQVLPLVFPVTQTDSEATDSMDFDLFAPIFVDNAQGTIRKSVSAEKVLPIETESITGVSTYFSRFHPGIDYRAKLGTAVHAILPGVVNEIGFQLGGYGRYIVLVHYTEEKTIFSLYAHLKETKVNVGDTVEAGSVIGLVGLTGRSTGPHLHFELHDTKTAMDPIKFFTSKALAMIVKK